MTEHARRDPHRLRRLGLLAFLIVGATLGWISHASSQISQAVVGCSGGVGPAGATPRPCLQPPLTVVPFDPVVALAYAVTGAIVFVAIGVFLSYVVAEAWPLRLDGR